MTLGQYLEASCFSTNVPCLNARCRRSVLHHSRYYQHGTGRVRIKVEARPGAAAGGAAASAAKFCAVHHSLFGGIAGILVEKKGYHRVCFLVITVAHRTPTVPPN
jgi:hypothetical protein